MTTIANSKFIKVLKTLNEAELRSFETWLNSPWCNTSQISVRLLEKIKAYHPAFDTPKLDKEKLFKRMLPNGKFSDRRMNNVLSDAYLTLEKFLIFQKIDCDEQLSKDLLIQEWQTRHLDDLFFRETYQEIDRLEAKPQKEWEDHLNLLRFHRRVYHHPNQNAQKKSDRQLIVEMEEQLELVYLLEKAAIVTDQIFRNRIYKNENYDVEREIKKWQIVSEGVEHSALEFYRLRFAYTEEKMLEQYFELRDKFLKEYEKLNLKEQKIHFAVLRNDTIKLIRAGHFDITELLPLYKIGLKQGLLMENGVLPYMSFSAIVATSNTKQDFDFTQEVIEVYGKKVDLDIRNEANKWAIAHTFYYQKNLESCLDILIKQEFKNKYFLQISKMLNLQVYFDLYLIDESYEDYLFSFFDAFEKWVQREKFTSKAIKKSFLRFIQISRSLAREYTNINFDAEKIQNILASEANIQASQWLKTKIQFIIGEKVK